MIRLGTMQTLRIVRKAEQGAYLAPPEQDAASSENKGAECMEIARVLLPQKQVGTAQLGDTVEVFVYKDSEDRPIATTTRPLLLFGEVSRLTVRDVTGIGAFLDWGLAKDLFLPFKEQTYRVKKGDQVLVALYVDKSSRLCATMKIYSCLSSQSPYQKEDQVCGTVYEIIPAFGAYVAVDDRFSALIPNKQLFTELTPGEKVQARVEKVQPDGRLELSIREKSYLQLGKDGELILELLNRSGGFLPYHDKTSPDLIKAKFGLSKNAFKRAIGHLKKEGKLLIEEDGISLP